MDVVKPEVIPRDPKAPPLRLDNEPDEIHGRRDPGVPRLPADESVIGFLIVPSTEDGALIVARVSRGTAGTADVVRGSWAADRWRVPDHRSAISPPAGAPSAAGDQIGFDLLVNEMQSGSAQAGGSAGVEWRRRLGLAPRRPAGSGEIRQRWNCAESG